MKRKTIAFVMTLVMLVSIIPLHTVFATNTSIADFTVIADKTTVKAGDEVTFTVKVTASDIITSWSFNPDIPLGLSYVANSGAVDADLKAITESDGDVSFTESSKLFYIDCSALDGLKGLNDLTIGTFKCVVDENAESKDYTIGIAISEVCDQNADPYAKDKYEAKCATIKVESKPIPVTGFTLDKTTATVETGDETLTLTPIFSPDDATNKNLTWSSNNENVATVKDGVVSLIKKGVATITATTEDGGYTASCVVTINCSHRKGNSYPAESSTCIKQGHGAYDVCGECGEIINGSDAKFPFADHSYAENAEAQYLKSAATCNSKAIYYKSCSVCSEKSNETFEYGELDSSNHIGGTYLKDQKEATCYEEGYTGDTYCGECNTKIASGTVIEKNAHNPASVWTTDADYHWKDCQTVGCGNIIDKASHSGGEATCVAKAVCSVCGVQYGEVNAFNHKYTEVRDAKDATCCEAGYTGDTWCTDCNMKIEVGTPIPATGNHVDVNKKWESDGKDHWHTCYFGTKFDIAAHSGGVATCKEKAVCSVCSVEYGTVNTNNHKNTEIRNVAEATCTTDGCTGDTYCKDCNVKISDGTVIPAGHKLDKVDAKAATHEADGNVEYYVCSVCGKRFKNADGTAEISEEDTVIAKGEHDYGDSYKTDAENHWKECGCGNIIEKAAHTFGDWNVVKEATATEAGVKERACTVCGYKAEKVITAVGSTTEPTKPTDPSISEDKDQQTKPTDTDKNPGKSPQTGDNSNIIFWSFIAVISLAALCTTGSIFKKKKVR